MKSTQSLLARSRRTIAAPVLTCFLTTALLPVVAFAQNVDDQVAKLEADAAAAYGEGNYKDAIALMAKANQLRPHPNYLLNIAVSYSKIGDCDNAKLWAQNAVDSVTPSLPTEGKAMGQAVIDKCSETAISPVLTPDPKDPKDDVKKPDPIVAPPPPQPASEPTPWLLYTGYGLAGLGGLIMLGTIARDVQLGDDIALRDTAIAKGETPELTAKEIEAAQGSITGGYVFGGLMAIGGGVLIYLELTDEEEASSWRITPLIDRTTVGVGFSLDL